MNKSPYLIGVTGSVAVGKSTISRILQARLADGPRHPNVQLVSTDGFIYPKAILEKHNLMHRKGFPESYDQQAMVNFLRDLKSGKPHLTLPVYSHQHYDILPHQMQEVSRSDIVVVEGLNVLQMPSDVFDFTIYVDADTHLIETWYLERFLNLRQNAKQDPTAFFHQFSTWPKAKARAFARQIWSDINEKNLKENILPFKDRADLILEKTTCHKIQRVFLKQP